MSTTRIKRKFNLIYHENTPDNTPNVRRSGLRNDPRSDQPTVAPLAKKRRTIKLENRVYRPQLNSASSHDSASVLAMRCDRSATVTSFLVETDGIFHTTNVPATPRTFNFKLSDAAKKSASYRPIKRVLSFNALGSPVKVAVASPNKKNTYTLTRDAKVGPVSLYSNRQQLSSPNSKMVTKLDVQSDFYQSEQYNTITKHFTSIKKQKIQVTRKLLIRTSRLNSFSGRRNQNEVMSGKANQYAQATHLFVNDLKWEWLHLVAHQIVGHESQQANNLVAGTYHANTLMIFVESELKALASRYPQGFTLEIKAHLMSKEDKGVSTGEYLQIGTQLEYRIVTPDFNILFPFNLQNPNQPHIDYQHYVHALFKAITDSVPVASSSTSDTSTVSHCFTRNNKN